MLITHKPDIPGVPGKPSRPGSPRDPSGPGNPGLPFSPFGAGTTTWGGPGWPGSPFVPSRPEGPIHHYIIRWVTFLRAMLCISTAYAVIWCPSFCASVCLSHLCILSNEYGSRILKLFSPPGRHIFLAFPYQTLRQYSDETPPMAASNAGGGMKNRYF